MMEHRPRQQTVVEIAALTIGPEVSMAMHKRSHRLLGAIELQVRCIRCHQPEWKRMAPGVIADPVAVCMCSLGECTMSRASEFLADHEEGRLDAAPCEYIQHQRRHIPSGAIVE